MTTGTEEENDQSEAPPQQVTKAGFVALLGPPNVGKSSLLNALLGERLAIVTAKPQTTRSRILGILPRPGAQILFLDTPGRHRSPKRLNEKLNLVVEEAARDCDVALLLVDCSVGWTEIHQELADSLREQGRASIVVGTKSDLPPERRRRGRGEDAEDIPWPPPEAEGLGPAILVSAKAAEGLDGLLDAIVDQLPASPALYEEDQLTDRSVRWLCAEIIREAVFELLDKELPYSMAVEVLRFDESNPKMLRIGANLLVERDSQKRIVVGKGGSMIKKIGIRSREAIEAWLETRVHLELFVKIDPSWLKSGRRIEELGYF